MEEIFKVIQWVQSYLGALDMAIDRTMKIAPAFVLQEMKRQVTRRIDVKSGKGGSNMSDLQTHYLNSINMKTEGTVLIVELDPNDWLSNALEKGVGAFDMKPGLLTSKNGKPIKTSKAGYKYRVIPIRKQKGNSPSGVFHLETKALSKESIFQQKINDVLKAPKYGVTKLKTMMSGKIVQTQHIPNSEPSLKGFYRTRTFQSAQHFHSQKGKPDWQYVLFRTVSENPNSKAEWQHPGITAHHIFRATEHWIDNAFRDILKSELENFIKEEMEKVGV